jgi:predicted DNA-binding transcriptional regulator YafY
MHADQTRTTNDLTALRSHNRRLADIRRCMIDAGDHYALWIRYRDGDGEISERVVSPTSWMQSRKGFVALCIGVGDMRAFLIAGILAHRVVPSSDYQMPAGVTRPTTNHQPPTTNQER